MMLSSIILTFGIKIKQLSGSLMLSNITFTLGIIKQFSGSFDIISKPHSYSWHHQAVFWLLMLSSIILILLALISSFLALDFIKQYSYSLHFKAVSWLLMLSSIYLTFGNIKQFSGSLMLSSIFLTLGIIMQFSVSLMSSSIFSSWHYQAVL